MIIRKIFLAALFSTVVTVSTTSVPTGYAFAAEKKVKECPRDFLYNLVFKRCIRDYAGGPRSS